MWTALEWIKATQRAMSGFVRPDQRGNPRVILPATLLFVAALAGVDYVTGDAITLSFFYLLPVIVTTTRVGLRAGLLLSLLCAVVPTTTEFISGIPFDPVVEFWNSAVRGASLVTVTVLVDNLLSAFARESTLSRTDALTQLSNTRSFRARAEREIVRAARYSRPLTLVFMDIDNFKMVNDDFGHAKGDELLSNLGTLLKSSVRSHDVVGRLGGDEFGLLLTETDSDAAQLVVDRIRQGLEELLRDSGLPGPVSFSMGLLTTDSGHDSIETLMHVADQLMYSAKRAGKNQVKAKDLVRSV